MKKRRLVPEAEQRKFEKAVKTDKARLAALLRILTAENRNTPINGMVTFLKPLA
jgi:hypothetical protein